jgi:hypothetical protein
VRAPRRLEPPLRRDQLAPALTWTPDSNGGGRGNGRDRQAGSQRASLGSREGSDGGARDGRGDGFGGSGPGSPGDRQRQDGGDRSREGAVTGPGQDGFGTPAAQASSGEPSGGGGGGGDSEAGSGRKDGSKVPTTEPVEVEGGSGGSGSSSMTSASD